MTRAATEGQLDPSHLPGHHRDRVFIGGSYHDRSRSLLTDLAAAVRQQKFNPIIADDYQLQVPERDIHDVTLCLLHSCRLAIFEVSRLSGALMEIERAVDYGTQCLILYADPKGEGWRSSRMLTSFVMERESQMRLSAYVYSLEAIEEARKWLRMMERTRYVC